MTTGVLQGGTYGGFVNRKASTFGASEMAGQLLQRVTQFFNDAARSALGATRWNDPLEKLFHSYEESCVLASRGEYRAPSPWAVLEAMDLIESLPTWAPTPTPLMEPSGAISLEWEFDRGRFFVLAVDGTGRIEYSAIVGLGDERFGVGNFSGAIPRHAQTLLAELIRK